MKGYLWILNNQKQHYYLPEICQLLGRSFERSRSHQLSWTYRGDIWPTVQLVCISLQSLTTALPPVKTMPSFCIRWRNTPTVCVCVCECWRETCGQICSRLVNETVKLDPDEKVCLSVLCLVVIWMVQFPGVGVSGPGQIFWCVGVKWLWFEWERTQTVDWLK